MNSRGDSVLRPNPWNFIFLNRAVGVGWRNLLMQTPAGADRAWVAITSDPFRNDDHQHPLLGSSAQGRHSGRVLPQWQYEVTSGGRIWYLIDEERRTLIMTYAGTGHPKATDTRRRRQR